MVWRSTSKEKVNYSNILIFIDYLHGLYIELDCTKWFLVHCIYKIVVVMNFHSILTSLIEMCVMHHKISLVVIIMFNRLVSSWSRLNNFPKWNLARSVVILTYYIAKMPTWGFPHLLIFVCAVVTNNFATAERYHLNCPRRLHCF